MNKQQAIRLLIDFISTVDDDELRAAVAALVANAPPRQLEPPGTRRRRSLSKLPKPGKLAGGLHHRRTRKRWNGCCIG